MTKKTFIDTEYKGVRIRIEYKTDGELAFYPSNRSTEFAHKGMLHDTIVYSDTPNGTDNKDFMVKLESCTDFFDRLEETYSELGHNLLFAASVSRTKVRVPHGCCAEIVNFFRMLDNIAGGIDYVGHHDGYTYVYNQDEAYFTEVTTREAKFEVLGVPVDSGRGKELADAGIRRMLRNATEEHKPSIKEEKEVMKTEATAIVIETPVLNFEFIALGKKSKPVISNRNLTSFAAKAQLSDGFVLYTNAESVDDAVNAVNAEYPNPKDVMETMIVDNLGNAEFADAVTCVEAKQALRMFVNYPTSWAMHHASDSEVVNVTPQGVNVLDVALFSPCQITDPVFSFGGNVTMALPESIVTAIYNKLAKPKVTQYRLSKQVIFANYRNTVIVKTGIDGEWTLVDHTAANSNTTTIYEKDGVAIGTTGNVVETTSWVGDNIEAVIKEVVVTVGKIEHQRMSQQQRNMQHAAWQRPYAAMCSASRLNMVQPNSPLQTLTSMCREMANVYNSAGDNNVSEKQFLVNTLAGVLQATFVDGAWKHEFLKRTVTVRAVYVYNNTPFAIKNVSVEEMRSLANVYSDEDTAYRFIVEAMCKLIEGGLENCYDYYISTNLLRTVSSYTSGLYVPTYEFRNKHISLPYSKGVNVLVENGHAPAPSTTRTERAFKEALFLTFIAPDLTALIGDRYGVLCECEGGYYMARWDGLGFDTTTVANQLVANAGPKLGNVTVMLPNNEWGKAYVEHLVRVKGKELEASVVDYKLQLDNHRRRCMSEEISNLYPTAMELINIAPYEDVFTPRMVNAGEGTALDIAFGGHAHHAIVTNGVVALTELVGEAPHMAPLGELHVATGDNGGMFAAAAGHYDAILDAAKHYARGKETAKGGELPSVASCGKFGVYVDDADVEFINYYAQEMVEHTYEGEKVVSIACAIPVEMHEATFTSIYGVKPNGESVCIADVHEDHLVEPMLDGLLSTI